MPERMARDHIVSWSLPGDLVLDPFAGAVIAIVGGMPTRTFAKLDVPSLNAVMTTLPLDTARTRPSGETVATASLLLM